MMHFRGSSRIFPPSRSMSPALLMVPQLKSLSSKEPQNVFFNILTCLEYVSLIQSEPYVNLFGRLPKQMICLGCGMMTWLYSDPISGLTVLISSAILLLRENLKLRSLGELNQDNPFDHRTRMPLFFPPSLGRFCSLLLSEAAVISTKKTQRLCPIPMVCCLSTVREAFKWKTYPTSPISLQQGTVWKVDKEYNIQIIYF